MDQWLARRSYDLGGRGFQSPVQLSQKSPHDTLSIHETIES